MLNKMKTMYKEWKEVVGLLAFVAMGITVFLLIDIVPVMAMSIALSMGAIGIASISEE